MAGELSENQVRARIGAYENLQTTDEIYTFGRMLLTEEVARIRVIESKATVTAGYASAVLVFVFSRFHAFPDMDLRIKVLTVVIAVLASLGIVLAVWALRISQARWFSDREWFQNDDGLGENVDLRKRYYIVAMHDVKTETNRDNTQKATLVQWAQACLGTAGVLAAMLIALQSFWNWK